MKAVLFDNKYREHLLPLTFTRPIAELRVGITTLKEKWENYFSISGYITEEYLSKKYPIGEAEIYIAGSVIASETLANAIKSLNTNDVLLKNEEIIAAGSKSLIHSTENAKNIIQFEGDVVQVKYPWDIFSLNAECINIDFKELTKGRKSAKANETNTLINAEQIFIEKGANVDCAILNASKGPIYIGKEATVMEGAIIKGPFALCEHATVKMAAKIDGETTVGPHSKVAGEISNSVILGYSNKGHDGYLGNSVLGEWCNLGADTNTSNLKNNYDKVKVWNYPKNGFLNTGLQFCGLIMGDHSKCGINTMFNTGTVVGVSANIFGGGFPRNFIPSYSWGGSGGFALYNIKKALQTAKIVYGRRELELNEIETEILETIYKETEVYRSF